MNTIKTHLKSIPENLTPVDQTRGSLQSFLGAEGDDVSLSSLPINRPVYTLRFVFVRPKSLSALFIERRTLHL